MNRQLQSMTIFPYFWRREPSIKTELHGLKGFPDAQQELGKASRKGFPEKGSRKGCLERVPEKGFPERAPFINHINN